jgi:hypothetical protein
MSSEKTHSISIRKLRHEISIGLSTIETAKTGLVEKPGNPESATELYSLGVEKLHQILQYLDEMESA